MWTAKKRDVGKWQLGEIVEVESYFDSLPGRN